MLPTKKTTTFSSCLKKIQTCVYEKFMLRFFLPFTPIMPSNSSSNNNTKQQHTLLHSNSRSHVTLRETCDVSGSGVGGEQDVNSCLEIKSLHTCNNVTRVCVCVCFAQYTV